MEDKKKFIPSYGRRGGRVIKKGKREALEEGLPRYQIKLEDYIAHHDDEDGRCCGRMEEHSHLIHPQNFFSEEKKEIWLEVGFGSGEHIIHRAKENPKIGLIGCEVYKHGVAECVKEIENNKLENVRIFTDDARILLDAIDTKSLDRVFVLFPDPWPKKRHHKRRIINHQMFDILFRIMKLGAVLHIATDHPEYARWIMVNAATQNNFELQINSKSDWETPPEGHIQTRYQQKNKAKSERPIFLNFKRK